jgi:hypothetical protein
VWIGLIFAYLFGYKLGLTPITVLQRDQRSGLGGPPSGRIPDPALDHAISSPRLHARIIPRA